MASEDQHGAARILEVVANVETLSWSLVESRLDTGAPWTLSMGGVRGVRIGFNPLQSRLYARLPADEDLRIPAGAYSQLSLELRQDETGHVMEVSTLSSKYFREFHRFASLLTEQYEQNDQTASGAFRAAIQGWQDLVSRKPILTPDQLVGLLGELLLLEGLVRRTGTAAADAWIGQERVGSARHDFRIGEVDLEVKTTRSLIRRHFIHGTQQLVPVNGHELYVLSLRLEAAGAADGLSLPAQVQILRALTGEGGYYSEMLEAKLQSAGYRDEDELFYDDRLIMSDKPRLIRVDHECPRITPALLMLEMKKEVAIRIEHVTYQVNFEGLGVLAGSPEYGAVLGSVSLGGE